MKRVFRDSPERQVLNNRQKEGYGRKGASGRSVLKDLLYLLGPFKVEFCILICGGSLLAAGEGIAQPMLVKDIFDDGVISHDFHRFVLLALYYVALSLSVIASGWAVELWSKSLDNRVAGSISQALLKSYYHSEYAPVIRNGHGHFVSIVYQDVHDGLLPLLKLARSLATQLAFLGAFSFVLAYLSWRAFLILCVLIPVTIGVRTLLAKKIRELTSKEREQEGAVLTTLHKALAAYRMVRVFNLLRQTVSVFTRDFLTYLSTTFSTYKVKQTFESVNASLGAISDFLSMFVAALFVLKGTLSFGGFIAFVNAFWRAVTSSGKVFDHLMDFEQYGVMIGRAVCFISQCENKYYREGPQPSVRNISFAYSGGRSILRNFSLRLAAAERVVLVGANGSGKTTLAHILSGYLAPSEGEVVLPRTISSLTLPIAFPSVKVRDLRCSFEILEAFGMASQSVLDALPDELSAGQQQKIAIAIALSQDVEFYIMDEPFTNLDEKSRNTAMKLICERTYNKNLVLIMHGTGFEKFFDRVVAMDGVAGTDNSTPTRWSRTPIWAS